MRCKQCEGPVPANEKQGRIRRFCSDACKQKSYRARRRRKTLPAELTSRVRWVRHDEKKRPLCVDGHPASVTDPSTWASHADVLASTTGTGMGIVLGDGLGCIDLDHCIEDNTLTLWAHKLIEQYRGDAILIERSMSGEGVHIFLPMNEGPGRKIRSQGRKIEIYSRARYIAVTGDRI